MRFQTAVSAVLILLPVSVPFAMADRAPVPFQDAGKNGYVRTLWREDYSQDQLIAMLKRIRSSGAVHLTIPVFGCQSSVDSADVGSCEVQSRSWILGVARLAAQQGFDVSLLPIIATKSWEWRGYFDPTDVDAWFRTYTTWILQVARDANGLGVKELVVGTEFVKLYRYEDRWRQVVASVRQVFSGPLILTVNWDDLDHEFWAASDAIGISAYFPLNDQADPSQDQLNSAWKNLHSKIHALSKQWNRPIHITEVGYPSTTSAARTPTSSVTTDPPDPALQQRCFSAFALAWSSDPSLVRANIWGTGDLQSATYATDFEPLLKPAEKVLTQFFGRLGIQATRDPFSQFLN